MKRLKFLFISLFIIALFGFFACKVQLSEETDKPQEDLAKKESIVGAKSGYGGEGNVKDIMLQTYHWGTINNVGENFYQLMINEAQNIANDGFTMVWFPPCSDTADQVGYLPRRLYDVNKTQQTGQSRYGKADAEVADAITAFHSTTPKVRVIADIVINHRIATNGYLGFTDPPMGGAEVVDNDGYHDDGGQWHDSGGWGNDIRQADRNGTEGDGSNYDSGINCGYAQDIVHENSDNSWTQTIIKNWMALMKGGTSNQTPDYATANGPGFDGWRYDMVKGYHGYYIQVYNDHTNPYFSVGEYWDYDDTQSIYDWINETHSNNDKKSPAFDFPTKKLLTQIWNGRDGKNLTHLFSSDGNHLPGMLKWWPAKAVTFLDNHDTATPHDNPYEFNTNEKALVQGNAYILTHPGIPCVFWKHYYDSTAKVKTAISTIANLRKDQGLHSTSSVYIDHHDWNCYMATIDNKVKIRIGAYTGHDPSSGWTLAYDGDSAGAFEVKVWTYSGGNGNKDTIVKIQKDVGYGNSLYLRGDTAPLSWNTNYPGTWTSGNWWVFNLGDMGSSGTFKFKGYTSYGEWQSDPDRTGNIAQITEVVW